MIKQEYIDISQVKMPKGLPKFNFYKKIKFYEVAVSLFETCNLHCKFCFERHNKPIDEDKIRSFPEKIINNIREDIIKYHPEMFIFKVWGGELFFDNIPDKLFDCYYDLYNDMKKRIEKEFPWIKFEISWLSNGVWTKKERVENLLIKTNSKVALSYDPLDRFSNDKELEIWKDNFEYLKNKKLLSFVAITLTKPNIYEFIKGDEIIKSIPLDMQIDVNYYAANPGWEKYIPSDEDLFLFFKWCVDNKQFNVAAVESFIRHMIKEESEYVPKWCTCKNSRQCIDGLPILDCVKQASSLDRKDFYGEYESETDESNCTEVKNSIGMLKRGCISCEHYKTCPQICWVSIIFKGYKTTYCPIKRLYNYITEKDINNYIQWRDKYTKDRVSIYA